MRIFSCLKENYLFYIFSKTPNTILPIFEGPVGLVTNHHGIENHSENQAKVNTYSLSIYIKNLHSIFMFFLYSTYLYSQVVDHVKGILSDIYTNSILDVQV